MITKLLFAAVLSCLFVLAQEATDTAPSNETAPVEPVAAEPPVPVVEEVILGLTTINEIEIELVEEKLALLKKRMAYLKHASGVEINPACLDDEIREQGEDFLKNYNRA